MLSNTLRMNFHYLKIIHIQFFIHVIIQKIIARILKNKQKKKYICKNEDENQK